jgi:hypothetical protein
LEDIRVDQKSRMGTENKDEDVLEEDAMAGA